jgi:hypothetical protein
MPINGHGYFDHLRAYLNMGFYGIEAANGELHLREKIFTPGGETTIDVALKVADPAFAIKLDKTNGKGHHEPLFHFLDNNAKPWSRRCDFVIFHLCHDRIAAHCMEYKWETLSIDSIVSQLDAGVAWCRTLCTAIKCYTSITKRVGVRKYVLSRHPNPAPYLDRTGKYLRADPSVRHYLYSEIDGLSLRDLDNNCTETIG